MSEMGWWDRDWDLWENKESERASIGGRHGDCMVKELLTAGEPRWGTAEEGEDSAEDGQTSFDYVVNIRTVVSKKRAKVIKHRTRRDGINAGIGRCRRLLHKGMGPGRALPLPLPLPASCQLPMCPLASSAVMCGAVPALVLHFALIWFCQTYAIISPVLTLGHLFGK